MKVLLALLLLGLALCVLAALIGVGESGLILFNLGAVIALLTGVAALCITAANNYLNGLNK